ncbi:siderophore-interacting protein [Pedobacter sp. ASV28]|uniref:siderophore-interacting protein n=1 Tax=Pedobacter sp. ASV28 TaxID=2795123 RepID=UPI0018EE2945|nr:siderophore-interacting protein [Pedobacter sp. ASV28]
MPHLPEWIVDTIENVLSSKFFDTEVVSKSLINPEILKVTFKADLQNMIFHPGWAVMLRAGTNDLRHYTISLFDRERGYFDIIFHIHGDAPGSNLAAKMEVGDIFKMAVPGGKKMYVSEQMHHFFFGDETSLSLMLILIDELKKYNGSYYGILESRPQNKGLPSLMGISMEAVLRTPETPGLQAINKLRQLINQSAFSLNNTVFYLTGNVASVQAFRKELKKTGINPKNIKLQGYWAEDSVGL